MIEALIGLVGVVVGSVIAISKDVWTSRLERRRDGSYSAIRLICILEEYADKCIDVVHDDGTACGQPAGRTENGEEYYVAQVSTPIPLDFPEDVAWRSLPEPLMHRVLALPNKARRTNRHIDKVGEYVATPPDYAEIWPVRQEGYARLGLDSLELADALQRHFGISARSRVAFNTDWDPVVFLRDKISTFEKRGS